MTTPDTVVQDALEDKLRRRMTSTQPDDVLTLNPPRGGDFEGYIPNTLLSVATVSFVLGSVFMWGVTMLITGTNGPFWWTTPQLGFFVASWAVFHFGEFATTAGWNRQVCSIDSFLLENGSTYHIANGTALAEYLITLYFKPSMKTWPLVSIIGAMMVIAGQALRSAAMITASTNFNHSVQFKKAESHKLVTEGVYAWFRHPSYTGFYYWALGTQALLQNPISFVLYSILLWRFFYYRTRAEEHALVRFFGEDYEQYRRRVGTWIPFVP